MGNKFDYIIVGAGSSGCVLANRLTENANTNVLLLEFGGSDRHPFIQMPSALSIPMNTKQFAWQFHSDPEPYLNNRRMHCPRGKVLGGSSSINGMVYVRGHPEDFNEWEASGAKGWNYNNCLPYFKKADDWKYGENKFRNNGGPLYVGDGNEMINPLYRAFIEAGVQAGYSKTSDYNAYEQEGFGPMQMTVKNGVRWSAAKAYLNEAKKRPNLTIQTHALVHNICFQGKKAIGVKYQVGEKIKTKYASCEIILSAGAIGSPHILQRSGVGAANVLKAAGVKVIHHSPGVGENLQDHLEFYFQFKCLQKVSLNRHLGLFSKAFIGLRWLLFKKGLGATNHFESCAFIRSHPDLKAPDIQYHFLPAAVRYDGHSAFAGDGFQMHVGHNKPTSRGRVHLKSESPHEDPSILFRYLQTNEDIAGFRHCVRLTRQIMQSSAMIPYMGDEIQPGEDIQSDDEIDAFIRENVESAYHPSCSCKMGADKMAVVNEQGMVHGMGGLRVVDASIFPTITNGNLNSPTIMVAERISDMIKNKC